MIQYVSGNIHVLIVSAWAKTQYNQKYVKQTLEYQNLEVTM